MLTQGITGFDGDPNTGSPPSIVANAPKGSFFLRETGFILYKKNSSSAGTWQEVGSGGSNVTTAPVTYYVSPTGSDSNPGTLALPFRQPTAALAKILGLRVRHLMKIELAAGTYNGFSIDDLWFDPLDDGTACGVHVYGTLVNATLTTGSPTGTLTSVTTAVVSTATFTVFTDSTQAWTVDELRGKHVEILSGTGVGQVLPIISNTATSLTVPVQLATSAAGATYAIRDCGSIITAPALAAGNLAGANGFPSAGAATSAGIIIAAPQGQMRSTHLRIEMLKVDLASPLSTYIDMLVMGAQALTRVERMQLVTNGGQSCLNILGAGSFLFNNNSLFKPTAVNMINAQGSALTASSNLSMVGNYIRGLGNGNFGMQLGGNMVSVFLANNQFDCDDMGNITGPCWVQLSGINKKTFTSNSNFGLRARYASGSPGGVFIHLLTGASLELSNCAASDAFNLEGGQSHAVFDGTFLGTNNLFGIRVANGARVRIGAGSTITGTTEVIMDGTGTTLANMRAQSPKVLTTSQGSFLLE